MFPNTADIDFGPASPPAGGINASSMIAGAKKPGLFSTANAMPRAGYVLGRAAQAIMGPYQNSPAALLGGVGVELSQQEAQRRTAARLLAGENLEDIEEASVLSPQQQQIVLGQAAERRKQNFEETKFKTEMEARWKELLMKGTLTEAEVADLRARARFTNLQAEGYESPAEKRKADTAAQKELIGFQGQEARLTELEKHGYRMEEINAEAGSAMARLERGAALSEEGEAGLRKQFDRIYLGLLEADVEPKEAAAITMKTMNDLATTRNKDKIFNIEEPAATPTTEGAPKKVYRTQEEFDKRDAVEPKPEKPAASWTDKLDPNTTAFFPVPKDPRPDWLKRVEDEGYGTKDMPVLIVSPKKEQLKWLKDGTYIANRNGQKFVVRGGQLYAAE